MTNHEAELMEWLRRLRNLRGSGPEGYEYTSVEDFLIREGTWYRPRALPADVKRGAPKSCFGNALILAIAQGWRYVEGVAIPSFWTMPVHHAWNVTTAGDLIDATWREPGLAYIGVPFSIGRADNATWFDNASVLDNPFGGHKLYQHKWQGECWQKVWRKSKVRKLAESMAKSLK